MNTTSNLTWSINSSAGSQTNVNNSSMSTVRGMKTEEIVHANSNNTFTNIPLFVPNSNEAIIKQKELLQRKHFRAVPKQGMDVS